jgi:hypothetical protein
MDVLFEPWSLGDALIAFDAFRRCPDTTVLLCDRRWKPILAELDPLAANRIFTCQLGYTYAAKTFAITIDMPQELRERVSKVYSIRGDPRDYVAMRLLFRKSRTRMSGWLAFLASKSWIVDSVYRTRLLEPKNRYLEWQRLLRLGPAKRGHRTPPPTPLSICIHVGSQWRSKRYPAAEKCRILLLERIPEARIMAAAGPGDPLPPGMREEVIQRVKDSAAIELLKKQHLVITNDSSAMHLCHSLNVEFIAVGRATNLDVWAPPGANALWSPASPRGVRSDPDYLSDKELDQWPDPETVVNQALKILQPIIMTARSGMESSSDD